MSFLAPLYALGMLAIGLPVLFHLIRRRPKAQSEFSSLMFLTQSPPRLTKRSRLDQWPLLLLRALAILLLALAFARPFLRSLAHLGTEPPGRKIVLLVDTSASMQRSDLWQQAKDRVKEYVDQLSPRDQIALATFDSDVNVIVPLDKGADVNVAGQAKLILGALDGLELTNAGSNLGAALVTAAGTLHNDTEQSEDETSAPRQIVLVSDLQEGCDFAQLQQYGWPKDVVVSVLQVKTQALDNLSAVVLPQAAEPDKDGVPQLRVRFHNSGDSQSDEFMYFWNASTGGDTEKDHLVQVPAGESRVVRVDVPKHEASSLMFVGDKQEFDNEVHVALPTKKRQSVWFLGEEIAEKKDSLFYYLRQAALGNPWREIAIQRIEPEQLAFAGKDADAENASKLEPHDVPLVIIGSSVSSTVAPALKKYLADGGHVLYVIPESRSGYAKDEVTLRELSDSRKFAISDASVKDYAMFGRIDFSHPIFLPFADPKYNDFTKIRFWSHRDFDFDPSEDWKTIARFDDQQSALVEKAFGRGRLWVLAAGWQPRDSQLALSTKFVPMLASMVDANLGQSDVKPSYEIGTETVLPVGAAIQVAMPDGRIADYEESVPLKDLTEPGLYRILDGARQTPFAMNVPASESRTKALAPDYLEQFGVTTADIESKEDVQSRERQMKDVELESQQRLWQWLIFAVLGVLVTETWLGGLLTRRATAQVESQN